MPRILLYCDHCCKTFRKNRQEAHSRKCTKASGFSDFSLCHYYDTIHLIPIIDGDLSLCAPLHFVHSNKKKMGTSIYAPIYSTMSSHHDDTSFPTDDIIEEDSIGSYHNNQSSSDTMNEIEKDWSTFTGLNGSTYEYQAPECSLSDASHSLPLPPEFKLPRINDLLIHPKALELMVFIAKARGFGGRGGSVVTGGDR